VDPGFGHVRCPRTTTSDETTCLKPSWRAFGKNRVLNAAADGAGPREPALDTESQRQEAATLLTTPLSTFYDAHMFPFEHIQTRVSSTPAAA
jgi:hypothetical protein